MTIHDDEISRLVRAEDGAIARKLFVDEDVYRLEMERLFAKAWLYLGHESQLKNPGDFFTTTMGEDPVLVTRGDDGRIRAFLNSCSHRGARVCSASSGNAKAFSCPYHGWTYSCDGSLTGVPRVKAVYFGRMDLAQHGLREVAQLSTFGGMIFATWGKDAEPLMDYLGDMAFYLDLMLNRSGGVEVIGGVHRWIIDSNWKFPSENFVGDYYHVSMTHASGVELGFRNAVSNSGYTISAGPGHGFASELGGALKGTAAQSAYGDFIAKMRQEVGEQRGEKINQIIPLGVGTIFPNLSLMDTVRFRSLRLWQPRGPNRTEVFSWCLVDASLPPDLKEACRRQYELAFGPSGLFEQDDGEIWTGIQASLQGAAGRSGYFNCSMGLGHDLPVAERFEVDWPGSMGEAFMTEANHRAYYRRYSQFMDPAAATAKAEAKA